MALYLCHLRLDFRILHDVIERLHAVVEITDTECTYSACLILLFHYAPTGKYIFQRAGGVMNIHKVYVIYLQPFEHSLKRILRIRKVS